MSQYINNFSDYDISQTHDWECPSLFSHVHLYIHKSLDNGNGALGLVPSQLGSQLIYIYILCVVKFKMAARFAEPTKVEIVALSEKATPENTKKQLNMELRFLTVSLRK